MKGTLGSVVMSLALFGSCGANIPEGPIDTYCYECYREIQYGEAFAPVEAQPADSTGGASR